MLKIEGKKLLFIDPGSKSLGWALFRDDGSFVEAGTLAAKGKDAFKRLSEIYGQVVTLAKKVDLGPEDEVHIETLNYGTHYMCIWSVGLAGGVLSSYGALVEQDVYIKSWQKSADWAKTQEMWREVHGPQVFDSEDAWAAYHMGIYWIRKRELNKKSAKVSD